MSGLHAAAGPKTSRARDKQAIQELPRGLRAAMADFCAVMAIPLCGSLLRQSTENLPRNLIFWTFLTTITVALIASHGGYAGPLRAASATGPRSTASSPPVPRCCCSPCFSAIRISWHGAGPWRTSSLPPPPSAWHAAPWSPALPIPRQDKQAGP
jgi:hypothetical protein